MTQNAKQSELFENLQATDPQLKTNFTNNGSAVGHPYQVRPRHHAKGQRAKR